MRRNLLLQQRLIQDLTPPVTIKTGIAEIRATVEVYLLQINCHLLHQLLLQLDRLKISTYQMIVKFNQLQQIQGSLNDYIYQSLTTLSNT